MKPTAIASPSPASLSPSPTLAQAVPPATEHLDGAVVPPELADHPRYKIVKILGEGGMGVVYRAEHRLMERTVALKVISRTLVNNPNAVERFRREVKTAGRLTHANIVAALDADQAGDLHFLVMEYVEGTTLARLVERHGPLPPRHACNYVRQAAKGLQHAHEHGMVHRDIKPHNLMLTKKGHVKVCDFGLARFAREANPGTTAVSIYDAGPAGSGGLTGAGLVVGTPDYIAPEQVQDSRRADVRSDIYSLGCTLYFLLAGHEPFPYGSAYEKVMHHALDAPDPLTALRPDLPLELAEVVERMMAKEPDERYQTPADVAQALLPFSRGTAQPPAVSAKKPSPPRAVRPARRAGTGRMLAPVQKPPSRWPWWPVVGVTALVLAAAALLVGVATAKRPVNTAKVKEAPPAVTATARPPRVLVVLPAVNFWNADYQPVRERLEKGGVQVVVASTSRGSARPDPESGGEPVPVDVLLGNVKPSEYDAIILGGGKGVAEFMSDRSGARQVRRIVDEARAAGKPVAALCMGVGVLAETGLLRGKRATGFDWLREKLPRQGVEYVDEPVVVDGAIITGRDPQAATAFADAVLRALAKR